MIEIPRKYWFKLRWKFILTLVKFKRENPGLLWRLCDSCSDSFYLVAPSSQVCCLMVQNGCSCPSHHIHIPTSKKEKRRKDIHLSLKVFPGSCMQQTVITALLTLDCHFFSFSPLTCIFKAMVEMISHSNPHQYYLG